MSFFDKLKYLEGSFWCANAEKKWKQIESNLQLKSVDQRRGTLTKMELELSADKLQSATSTDKNKIISRI